MSANAPKILFLNHSSELGGGELSLFDIARNIENSEVILFKSGPFEERLKEANIPTSIVESGAVLNVRRDDGVWKILWALPALFGMLFTLARSAHKADLIYTNSQKAFVVGAFVSAIARRPLIWHLRDLLTPEHFSASMRRSSVLIANIFADHVIANSQATANAFIEAGGRKPCTVIHSCIDAERFNVPPANLNFPRPDRKIVLGVFSRLASWKGQHVAIEALEKLPDYHLVLVGDALFGETHYAAGLHKLADELGVTNRVHFLGFRDDLAAIMNAVDVVLHTSTSAEPFGRVIVEGMAAGKPVVATGAGGALEIVQNEINGLLTEPGNSDDLANAVRAIEDEELYTKLVANGTQTVKNKFSLASSNRQILEVIESIIRKKPQR